MCTRVHGRVRGHDEGAGRDHGPVREGRARRLPALELLGPDPHVELDPQVARVARQGGQIGGRVDLGLVPEAQGGAAREGRDGELVRPLDGEPGAGRGGELLLQVAGAVGRVEEEPAVDAPEAAAVLLGEGQPLDPVDRPDVALGGQPRGRAAVRPLQRLEAVVEGRGQVRRREAGLTAPELARVDHDDVLAGLRQEAGGREPGDARAHHAHLRAAGRRPDAPQRLEALLAPGRPALAADLRPHVPQLVHADLRRSACEPRARRRGLDLRRPRGRARPGEAGADVVTSRPRLLPCSSGGDGR